MDAQAILLKLGWSGPGNPLNPNARPGATSGLGLTRPILVARRKGNSGVGNKTTKDPTNQWWLRGFEDALKGVGEAARPPTAAPAPNALTSELYRFFVRGEVVAGTLGDVHKGDGEGEGEGKSGKGKRKRDGDDDDKNGKRHGEKKETKEERKARKEERRKRKEERRVKREEKVKRREEREARRADRKLRREKKAAAKLLKRRTEGEEDAPRPQYEDYPTPPVTEQEQEQEQTGAKVKTQKKKDRKDKKTKEEKKTPKESKKRKTREEASTDAAPKKVKKSKAAE
ncbi:hypothetical protein BO86DRAFT_410474 [Aspergillus japonicus CBS 114.51]|uniref:G-patch domain-containing protein n=1 Tax=Aspergillus japonicus CBS 114.51 TaxID=1448312 RepID=A0A8T8WYN9_ASPJA|nr:hypothetical protein BO86DRAFT_410474 [Aspergillus japonicus CBS 114.51]RAH80925.1 hypothetical protein BO86DRAFT_410474 [Aspergillus japonicus CBS 114.51]